MASGAIMVLEREISALATYERRLDRQLEKWPSESDKARGARQAKDVCIERTRELRAAVSILRGKM
jgi:hypothetical protein